VVLAVAVHVTGVPAGPDKVAVSEAEVVHEEPILGAGIVYAEVEDHGCRDLSDHVDRPPRIQSGLVYA